MHVNGHKVTAKHISGVHSGTSRKLNDWFPPVCLSRPYAVFAKIVHIINAVCGSTGNEATLCAAKSCAPE